LIVAHRRTLQTLFSVKANDLADSFRMTVGRMRVGPHAYAPDLTAPDGVSTGGGVQALQHLRLLPPQPNMPTLVVGHVNQRDGAAELRTFDHLDAICRERFKQGPPFEPGHYAQLLDTMQSFLSACGLRVALAGPPADLTWRPAQGGSVAPPRKGGALVVWVAGGIVLVGMLLTALVWFFKK
jgi:hypothetical protein